LKNPFNSVYLIMRLPFFLFAVLFHFSALAQQSNKKDTLPHAEDSTLIQGEWKVNEDSMIVVEVLLINDLKTTKIPDGGSFGDHPTISFKFKVIKVLSGVYPNKTIRISIDFPQMRIDQKELENNQIYTYKLRPHFWYKYRYDKDGILTGIDKIRDYWIVF
jgi:hypothetical protein